MYLCQCNANKYFFPWDYAFQTCFNYSDSSFYPASLNLQAVRVMKNYCSLSIIKAWFDWCYHGIKIVPLSCQGLGTTDSVLIRIMVARAEIDMLDIKAEFLKMYGKTLPSFIKVSAGYEGRGHSQRTGLQYISCVLMTNTILWKCMWCFYSSFVMRLKLLWTLKFSRRGCVRERTCPSQLLQIFSRRISEWAHVRIQQVIVIIC